MPVSAMIQKIKRIFNRKLKVNEGTRLVINKERLETRVALMENGILEEYNIERPDSMSIVGGIFKGKVKNVEHGLKAMFVDIGFDKNAFLHFWDAVPAARDDLELIDRGNTSKKKHITSKDIPNLYPVGSEIMVQVSKGPIGTKGPRVTTNISLAGRLLVLMPYNDQFGISRKIEDPKERQRLRKVLEQLKVPEGMGVIMRTVSIGKRRRHFVRDLRMLVEEWKVIEQKRDSNAAPVCVFQEPDLVERTVRDFLTEEVDEVVCDDLATFQRMQQLTAAISRRSKNRIYHHTLQAPIFEHYHIQKQINDAFHRQVWLPCGGYIVIDETEALVSIDVNTGRNRGAKDEDKMILETNVEAAREVARQLRLRNIGGLVVVDFIDMRSRKDQQMVANAMKERLYRDKARTQVLPISQLGLMEMTRQRLNESLLVSLNESCPYCDGRGRVKTVLSMSIELQRMLAIVLQKLDPDRRDLIIIVPTEILQRLRSEDSSILVEFERKYQCRLTFRADPSYHREKFQLLDAKTNQEIKG